MKTLAVCLFTLVSLSLAHAGGTSMKVEGNCSGKLADGSDISYTYYSNFNGCKKVSTSAVSFQGGLEGLYTGTRAFSKSSDIYKFYAYTLVFANSTGNTTGKLTYRDQETKKKHTITLQCEVRDYEYGDC